MSPATPEKTTPESKRLKAVATLWEKRKELHAALADIDDEIADILGGNAAPAERMKAVSIAWRTAWEGRYGTAYVWAKERDYPAMRRLVKVLPVPDIVARITVYLRKHDPFFLNSNHSFGLFCATINQHATIDPSSPLLTDAAPAVDCRHAPRCADDVAHSARVRRERASA